MFNIYNGDCLELLKTLDDNSIDSIVTDPPYGIEFMNKGWDKQVPGVDVWQECLRVLKPGGHLLAFAGTRTQHRMATNIEDAGFEVRDMIAWAYGSGFPKNLDVSKAIDRIRTEDHEAAARVAVYLSRNLEDSGKTRTQLEDVFKIKNISQQWFTTNLNQYTKPRVPKWDQWLKIKEFLSLDDTMDEEVFRLNSRKGQPGESFKAREVVGSKVSGIHNKQEGIRYTIGASQAVEVDITKPKTPDAIKWEGWGTAIKPAMEPITVARKPFTTTVAQNVLKHGTGAININASRIGERFPANIIHDGSDEFDEILGKAKTFFYCPKTSKKDRGEGNNHPTVKPTDLMRYLCTLVTQPGGTILDPFAGSGSTGRGAVLGGFDFIGIELDSDFCEIAYKRIKELTIH